jgi:HPt (histidine-containing phosphotransfer) domain-containing protein
MEEQFQIYDFLHLEQTESLLADRKLAFLNSYAIASHRISFLAPQTKSACFIPLREKTLLGFIILENNSTSATLSAGIESTMMYAAKIISEWLSWQEWTQDELDEPGPPSAIMKFKNIDGLDVDSALADMGGLFDVYEQSVKLTARLLPETIDKMDECISDGNSKGFEIEIHGIKGVLRNIGARTLGNKSAHLEKAALAGEIDCCRDEYPAFRELLTKFMEQLNMAVKVEADKEKIDKETLLAALKTAKSAAESFDTMQALEAVSPLAGFSYNEEADELFEKVIFALEEFKCESALINIIKMEEMME